MFSAVAARLVPRSNNLFDMQGKYVLVAGGSKGLGREICLALVERGAHVTAIARSYDALERIARDMEAAKVHEQQVLGIQSLDLTNSEEVSKFVNGFEKHISALFCTAGGTDEEVGYFADISATSIQSCMEKNYLTSAYITHAVMKVWKTDLELEGGRSHAQEPRHIVFTASTAALVAVPGYAAYSPSKAAIRALADTLRQESLMYSPSGSIRIHCSFPGTIYTDNFYREQTRKPDLCKELEGTMNDEGGLTARDVAQRILAGLDTGCYFIPTDLQTRLLLNNMRGPSPRDSPLLDWCMGLIISLVWPLIGTYWDWKVARHHQRSQ
ncbi:NAD(P)-binding protein [Aspergillus sclerotioniger CBS 115572]|uniref:NAD(P)-binding protein n=1 Tax=Aspergillus sclerotioniger CBS 115572 TaxID=1450535 RepID=A0A317X8S0_9EURO|nr:NAD(P)-binding protein [Aspergillus sclerotioniger CBS 115572]PWY95013.1 NAD(P)-binding protein [Aspergillus sclerotioniger CBS 115572]